MSIQNLSLEQLSSLSEVELSGVTLDEIGQYFECNSTDYLGVVYSYTSMTSGMKYIGQTKNPIRRNGTHISSSKVGTKRKDANSPLYVAVRNEGFDNFRYNVLKVVYAPDRTEYIKTIDAYEHYFIDLYNTTDKSFGFNVNSGGLQLPLSSTSYWARAVKQYAIFGEFIKEYKCMNDAARETNIGSACISEACSPNSTRKVAGGFLWTYSEDSLNPEFIKHATRGVIHRYSIDGKYIDSFTHCVDVAKLVDGDCTRIFLCAEPPYNHIAYGYRWSREKLERLTEPPAKLNVEVHKYDKDGIYVASYDTQIDGAKSIGRKYATHLGVCLKDHWRKAGGFYWRTFKTDKIDVTLKSSKCNG